MTYGTDLLHEEVSYLAYHLHWPLGDLLNLEHADRRHYVQLVQRLSCSDPQARPEV